MFENNTNNGGSRRKNRKSRRQRGGYRVGELVEVQLDSGEWRVGRVVLFGPGLTTIMVRLGMQITDPTAYFTLNRIRPVGYAAGAAGGPGAAGGTGLSTSASGESIAGGRRRKLSRRRGRRSSARVH